MLRCHYCQRAARDLTKDHVVPKSKGGKNGNIVLACRLCNNLKGSSDYSEFMGWVALQLILKIGPIFDLIKGMKPKEIKKKLRRREYITLKYAPPGANVRRS